MKKWGPFSIRTMRLIGAFSILFVFLVIGARLFGDCLYDYPPNPDLQNIPTAAVIVCLAGGRGRVHTAIDLFAKGIGSELAIIGAGPKTNVQAILKTFFSAPGAPRLSPERLARIHIEKDSRNTIENAYAVENFLRQNPAVHDIVLITSAYHMRRSLLVVQSVIQKEVHVIPYIPEKEVVERENWWDSWVGIEVTLMEYGKYLLVKVLIPNLSYF